MISGSNEQLQQQLEYTPLKPDCYSWGISKMLSGREDTVEERYAIKFCFKLGKNPIEMYGMLQTAFDHLAWIEHQFLSGIRDSRSAGSLWGIMRGVGGVKKVNTPELIGQIKNFMDKNRRVSIETICAQFDVSVGNVHTIIREELKMWKICANFVPRFLREDQKERRWHDSREMVELINSGPQFLMLWWPAMKAGSFAMTQRPRDRVPSGSMLALPDLRRPDRANPPTNFWWSLFWQHWHDLNAVGSHWTDSQLGILCWGFKGVQEEIPSEEASTLEIGSVAFPPGQCTSSQLHPCHRLFDQDGHQDSSSPSLWSRPCSLWLFAYSRSSRKNLEVVVMRQLRRWKRLWRRSLTRSHKRTSMGLSRSCWNGTTSALRPGEITSKGTRISCVYYQ